MGEWPNEGPKLGRWQFAAKRTYPLRERARTRGGRSRRDVR